MIQWKNFVDPAGLGNKPKELQSNKAVINRSRGLKWLESDTTGVCYTFLIRFVPILLESGISWSQDCIDVMLRNIFACVYILDIHELHLMYITHIQIQRSLPPPGRHPPVWALQVHHRLAQLDLATAKAKVKWVKPSTNQQVLVSFSDQRVYTPVN